MAEVVARHAGSAIAIVAHGGVIRTWIARWLGLDLRDMWSFGLDNASISLVHPDHPVLGGRFARRGRVVTINDCAHLATVRGSASPPG